MKGVRRVVVVDEVGEVCLEQIVVEQSRRGVRLEDVVEFADEIEQIVVEQRRDRHEDEDRG